MARKYESTKLRREQIVNAAMEVIVKYGSEHVTVKRIAKEVGISEAAIYRHFKSKRDVLSLLIDDIENTLLSEVKPDFIESPFTEKTLDKAIMDHIANVIQRKGTSFQVIAEIISLGDKKLNKKVYDVIISYTEGIRELLAKGVEAGVISRDIDIEAAANVFFGMTQGLVNTWALSQYSFNLGDKYNAAWLILREAITRR